MITSNNNQQVKQIIQLEKKKRVRGEQGLFIVEGLRMVRETPIELLESIYVSKTAKKTEACTTVLTQLRQQNPNFPIETVDDGVFMHMSDTTTPQGILAVVKMPHYELSDLLKKDAPLLLLLEDIQDPGNLGTMFRTAEAAGIDGIIMNQTTVDVFNPKTVRSTMGSLYRQPFVIVSDWVSTLQELQQKQIRLYAAHLQGSVVYDQPDYRQATGFLIGNEGNGLSLETVSLANEKIHIPMVGQSESLNAAMASGILMYEALRQRRR